MIPSSLNDWTYEKIELLCQAGQSESDRHDFKYNLSSLKDPEKICCAFANSQGGFIVVGIKEKNSEFIIEGLEPDIELYGNFLKKIKIEPTLEILPPKVIDIPDSTKKIYVFEIPKSPKRPHIPSVSEKRFFYKRNGSNCIPMTLEEIKYQIHNFEEKKDKLTLILIELTNIELLMNDEINRGEDSYSGTKYSFEIIDKAIVETYSFLKDDLPTVLMLNQIKNHLTHLNSEKSKLMSIISMSYDVTFKLRNIKEYRDSVIKIKPYLDDIKSRISESFFNKFGVSNPYKVEYD